ncbi:multidrug ABC transporter permease [Virgisporangium aurantiacum]|uniref:Multidrug ABC transporter permease n=1 Tax=Virgisporangium aurantiacum TaxID=175570 RepID=A0A8J3ZBH0_9ACTN|nr:multidrug ABC transporter permease [Virgisporangium aurantiacum]
MGVRHQHLLQPVRARLIGGREVRPAVRRHLRAAVALAWRASPSMFVGFLLLDVVAAGVPVTVAWLTKVVLDRLSAGGSALGRPVAALALCGVLIAVLPRLSQHCRIRLGRRVGLLATERLYTAVDALPGLRRFEDPVFADRLRLAGDAARVTPNRVVEGMLGTVRGALTAGAFVASLAVISPAMTVVLLVAAGPVLAAELWLGRRRARTVWQIGPGERRVAFYAQLLTDLQAAKEIRLFGTGGLLRARMLRERRDADAELLRTDRWELVVEGGLSLLAAAVAGAGLIWAVGAAGAGELSIGDVSMFIAAVAGTQVALGGTVTGIGQVHDALLLYDHYDAVVRTAPDLPLPSSSARVRSGDVRIEFRDVWFRYDADGPWALRGVDLVVPAGRATALVGRNGAGKSTLVKLLCRFYDPTRGAIRWNGVDLRDVDPAELRRHIGAIFQDFMCYDLTARENIALGDISGVASVRRAAELAGIDEALASLPRGYDTLLSRTFLSEADKADPANGVLLSGGQWQRVALARGLLRDAGLVILDEPSAGLDAEAEHEIHRMLADHRRGRTSLLISHRLGAIRDADTIAVLDAGRVVEQGTHDDLVDRNGVYARLFALQADGYRAARGRVEA